MEFTGGPHMPGYCWCGRFHVLTDGVPASVDFPMPYRPLNPGIQLGPLPRVLTEDEVRRIVREEIGRVKPESGDR